MVMTTRLSPQYKTFDKKYSRPTTRNKKFFKIDKREFSPRFFTFIEDSGTILR